MTDVVVYGIHAVGALLNNPLRKASKLYIQEDRQDKKITLLMEKAQEKNCRIELLNNKDMQKRFPDLVHQGIVAVASPLPDYQEKDLLPLLEKINQPLLILILDGITDPHNLGACLRTADAAGVHAVIIPKDKSASITPVVSKVASGAAESMPLFRVTNLVRSMELLKEKGVWLYGAAGEACQTLYQFDYTGHIALILGAEGDGLRRLTREHCDGLFSIPMLGSVDSLNVSVATGIALYETVRQRKGK